MPDTLAISGPVCMPEGREWTERGDGPREWSERGGPEEAARSADIPPDNQVPPQRTVSRILFPASSAFARLRGLRRDSARRRSFL